MEKEATVTIDGREVHALEGASIMAAADAAGIYIPRLCHHPALPPGPGMKPDAQVYRHGRIQGDTGAISKTYEGCNICIVEIEGRGICRSCATIAEGGMVIHSDTDVLKEARKEKLAGLLSLHPHACLLCAEREGCDRETCTMGVAVQGRCCDKFDDCEFQSVCEYVGIKKDVSQYAFRNISVVDTPFFSYHGNLCIGCGRCVRACEMLQGKRVIGFTFHNGEFVMGTTGPTHRESGCVFCGGCVAVCPTGALMDKGLHWKKKAELKLAPVVLPPEEMVPLTEENVNGAPEVSGVYELCDGKKEILYIKGAENIRKDLQEKWKTVEQARFFRCEEHGMYSMRENELLERFLKKHGALPQVNNEIEDLY